MHNSLQSQQPTVEDYNILHVASHGIFNKTINDSYIISGDGKLTFIDIDKILTSNKQKFNIIVLSACETAIDSPNDLAFLGLAGLGVRAGISTVLGNLWASGDETGSQIIVDFYYYWKKAEMTKSEALRKAQLRQIKKGKSPHLWAAPILLED